MVAVTVGFSLWGCSDEKAGPGVGPDTSWQIFCGIPKVCGTGEQPHGPLDGQDPDEKADNYKLSATCKKEGSGLTIRIETPHTDANPGKKIGARARSILSITRAKVAKNECFVTVTEYPVSNGNELKLQDACTETDLVPGVPGTCVLEGKEDSNGYAFEGSIICDGMKYNAMGDGAYELRQAREQDEPVKLQIDNCD